MNIPKSDLPRVVIIGAGFAGLQAAKRINTKHYQIVLIDKNNYHTFQPLLYQVASAGLEPDSIAYPIRKSLRNKANAFYRMAEVNNIDPENKVIQTDIGELYYDYLILATGATNNYFNNESIEANAIPMKSLVDALDLRSKILESFEKALNTKSKKRKEELMNFVIVGAGPTGVELTGALAELKNKILPKDFPDLDLSQMHIHLIEGSDTVLSGMSLHSSKKATESLQNLGVEVWTNMLVEGYENNEVVTSQGVTFRTDTLIWAAGVKGVFPDGFSTNFVGSGNRLITDQYCRIPEIPTIYVLGDAGLVQSEEYPKGLPMLASVAMQQGIYLAKALNQLAKNKTVQPFRYLDKGIMATIGRNKAVVEIRKLKFTGIFAWFVWMSVHLMLLVGFRNRIVVFINWAWNYVKYNNGHRLIVRPFKRKKPKRAILESV